MSRLRNFAMDAGHRVLWQLRLYGTAGAWDAWCDRHGRWDRSPTCWPEGAIAVVAEPGSDTTKGP